MRLDGVRAKLDRAKEHLKAFDAASDRFMESDPYAWATEEGEAPNQHLIKITTVAPVPVDVALIIGDALHNMRCAMDYIVYADWPTEKAQFPICLDHEAFTKGFWRIKGAKRLRAKIEALQPYQPGNGGETNVLWLLSRLSNADKHHTLHLTSVSLLGTTIRPKRVQDCEIRFTTDVFLGKLEGGTVMGRLTRTVTGPNPEMEMALRILSAIGFDQAGPGRGQPALDLLTTISTYIESLVPEFEQLL